MFSLGYVKDRLRHRLKANNRHGLHSPFVYRLVDKVFYDGKSKKVYSDIELSRNRTEKQSPRIDQLLYRFIHDQQPGNMTLLGNVPEITRLYIKQAAPDAKIYTSINDAVVLDIVLIAGADKERVLEWFGQCLPHIHDSSCIIMNGIYKNEDMKEVWANIKNNPSVTVTIELFWLGLVFFRKGQAREDFWIRY